jgi:hypothetical protein
MAASSGRKGRPWRRCRAIVLSVSTVCHLCGHEGARDGDHHPIPLQELKRLGLDPDDARYVKPAHGANSRCPTCGRCCNQVKGAKVGYVVPAKGSRNW